MPDWSYRTVFRPVLFRLPPATARDLALGFLGRVAALPLGGRLIDFLGHMRPDERLRTQLGPLELAGPVVLGPWLDPQLRATQALSRFGVGLIEVGPADMAAGDDERWILPDLASKCIRASNPTPTLGAANDALARLSRMRPIAPIMVRIAPSTSGTPPGETVIADLAIHMLPFTPSATSLGTLDHALAESWPLEEWHNHLDSIQHAIGQTKNPNQPLWLALPADMDLDRALPYLRLALRDGIAGLIVDGRVRQAQQWLIGSPALPSSLGTVRRLRAELSMSIPLIAGGAIDPKGAMELIAAGADAVQVDAGLVCSGPGLCKRINDAVLFARCCRSRPPGGIFTRQSRDDGIDGAQFPPGRRDLHEPHAAAMSWFWAFLLAVAMLLGGAMALVIALTRVVLPYDEAYLGMTADELRQVNPRLLHFMIHDRVTLAGTMLTVGIQFGMLSWFGIRRGMHWAKVSVLAAAFAGFFTFFLFLGFGYFDPFHAFVTAINFQFVLLALAGRLGPADPPPHPHLEDDRRWRLAQWGQLLLLMHAAAVIVAGLTICCIGSTSVFVAEDLEFMQTTAEALEAANPRLVPVVAHDRASFGGMLLAIGIATLLPALWGIRQGATWLWWMFALSATIGYGTTLVVHLAVGYTDIAHLAPAVGGLAVHWLAMSLLFPYMKPAGPRDLQRWDELLTAFDARQSPQREEASAATSAAGS